MFRGNRRYILAALGWLILAASPPQQNRAQPQPQAEQQIANSLENVAAAIERGNERTNYNPACEQGTDNRRSDLCAQWKAADSAHESAALALVGAGIGFLTLCAAVAAAYFASEAAKHTKTSADEARRTADAAEDSLANSTQIAHSQLRAYVASTLEDFEPEDPNASEPAIYMYKFKFYFKNAGQTPAHQMQIRTVAIWRPKKGKTFVMLHDDEPMGTVSPQAPVDLAYSFKLDKRKVGALKAGRAEITSTVTITYVDDFDIAWRYVHDLRVTSRTMVSGKMYTVRCSNERVKPPEPSEPELPLTQPPAEEEA
jgi:hypothetical protein